MPDAWRSRQPGDGSRLGRTRYTWPWFSRKPQTLTQRILRNHASDESLQPTWNGRTTTPCSARRSPRPMCLSAQSLPAQNCLAQSAMGYANHQPSTCQNPKALFGVAQARIRQGQLRHHSSLVCKHDTPALNLLDVETHQPFAMWAVYGKRADGSEPKVWIVAAKWCFLKCNKASARWVGAPDCQIPLRRRHEIVDRWAGDVVNGTIPLACCRGHFTFRFSAEDFPRLLTISYSTCWPSLSVPSPARSTAEMCTKTS